MENADGLPVKPESGGGGGSEGGGEAVGGEAVGGEAVGGEAVGGEAVGGEAVGGEAVGGEVYRVTTPGDTSRHDTAWCQHVSGECRGRPLVSGHTNSHSPSRGPQHVR